MSVHRCRTASEIQDVIRHIFRSGEVAVRRTRPESSSTRNLARRPDAGSETGDGIERATDADLRAGKVAATRLRYLPGCSPSIA